MNAQSALGVHGLSVSYREHQALHDISFRLRPGSMTAVVGPNGAGKSTLLKAILSLVPVDSGAIEVFGRPVAEARRVIAYVPQRSEVDWSFPISVRDTALLGTYPRLKFMQRPGRRERAVALEALSRVGLEELAHRQIDQLSGGQQQRVFIARALAQAPRLMLLDEPYAAVDAENARIIAGVLQGLADAGTTMLVVHHDLAAVQSHFEDVLLLNREIVAHGPANEALEKSLLERAYRLY